MKHVKTLILAAVTLSLPLTMVPLSSVSSVNAATVSKKTYTGTGTEALKKMKKTAYHSKDSTGNIYQADFMADKPTVTLTKKTTLDKYRTTWYATKKMTLKIGSSKERTYYYITSSDKKVSGWTWKGNLTKGIFKSAD